MVICTRVTTGYRMAVTPQGLRIATTHRFIHTFRPPEAQFRLSIGRHISGPLAFETVPSEAKLIYSSRSIFLVEVPGGSSGATLVPYLVNDL